MRRARGGNSRSHGRIPSSVTSCAAALAVLALSACVIAICGAMISSWTFPRALPMPSSKAGFSTTQHSWPIVAIEAQSFGLFRPGQSADSTIRLRNLRKVAITVQRVEASCPCLDARNLPLSIRPGEAADLAIHLGLQEEPSFRGKLMIELTGLDSSGLAAFQTRVCAEVEGDELRSGQGLNCWANPPSETQPSFGTAMQRSAISTQALRRRQLMRSDNACRIPELDALRAIGALMILGLHLWPAAFFLAWTRADLFFAISGYVITDIILRHERDHGFLFYFWARRAIRIWPAYFLMLAIVYVAARADGFAIPAGGLIAHATFTQNLQYYWTTEVPYFPRTAVPTWSLAIEEQFYVVWPLLILLVGRSILLPAALWLVGVSVAMRLAGVNPSVALARADGLALGAILAALRASRAVQRPRAASALLAVTGGLALLLASGSLLHDQRPIPRAFPSGAFTILIVSVLYTSVVGLVIINTGHRRLSPLRWPPLLYLGRVSYGLYLYHYLVIESVQKYVGRRTVTSDLAAIALSILAGVISWECLEKPVGRLKRLFPYQSRDTDPTDALHRSATPNDALTKALAND